MIRAALLCLIAAPAAAQEARVWSSYGSGIPDSHVTIHAPTAPNAAASVTFKNTTVHSQDETFQIEWQGIGVEVVFDWQAGDTHAESITIIPPRRQTINVASGRP